MHPRPDERHITYQDVHELSGLVNTEFNVEGYPSDKFMDLVLSVKPAQVTLVPDPPGVLTSNSGWDTVNEKALLDRTIDVLHKNGIRTSLLLIQNRKILKELKFVVLTESSYLLETMHTIIIKTRKKRFIPS